MNEQEKLLRFAGEVNDLGAAGLTQEQIAEKLGVALGTLKYRLAKLGLTVTPGSTVIDVRSREPFSEMLARGEFGDRPRVPAAVAGSAR